MFRLCSFGRPGDEAGLGKMGLECGGGLSRIAEPGQVWERGEVWPMTVSLETAGLGLSGAHEAPGPEL